MTIARLLVDCDTGIDDALALLYLAGSEDAEMVAAGSVHGNIPADRAADNTMRVLELCGLHHVPVAVGARRPMAQPLRTEERVHGEDGLGNTHIAPPVGTPIEGSAVEQIVHLARRYPGELTLLATGPLTNLGTALLVEPELPKLIETVVVMGGAASVPGNATAVAEANIWHDPEAAELVFSAPWKLRMVGLDVTMRALLGGESLERIRQSKHDRARFAWAILQHYLDVYERALGIRACALHDPLAAALALDPSLATWNDMPVLVELGGRETRGATVVDLRGYQWPPDDGSRPAVSVALEVDASRFLERFLERVGI